MKPRKQRRAISVDTTPDSEPGPPVDYRQAAAELEQILARLESSTVDVDLLASEVRRAVSLISFCRRRLTSVESELDEALLDLAQATPGAAASAPTGNDPPGNGYTGEGEEG